MLKRYFLAFFLVVAIGQIYPLIFGKFINFFKIAIDFYFFCFYLHYTYQERRRDGPYDVLATLKIQGAKSHSINGGR